MCGTQCTSVVAADPASEMVDSSQAEDLSSWAAALTAMDDVSETALQQQFAYYEVRPRICTNYAAFEPGHAKTVLLVRSLFWSPCLHACDFWTGQSVVNFLPQY